MEEIFKVVGFIGASLAYSYFGRMHYLTAKRVVTMIPLVDIEPYVEFNKAKLVTQQRNIVGECPIWDESTNSLMWVDIEGYLFQILSTITGELQSIRLPYRVGSFSLCESGVRVLLALENGFAWYNLYNFSLKYLNSGPYLQLPGTRLNDGRVDRNGRFIVGGFNGIGEGTPEWEKNISTYSVSYDPSCDGVSVSLLNSIPKVRCSNSICFSLDGNWMFYADSPDRAIECYRYKQKTGEPEYSNTFVRLDGGEAVPDGSIVDSSGYLWSSEWGGNRVVRYQPVLTFVKDSDTLGEEANGRETMVGKEVEVIDLPTPNITCTSLGGPNLNWLFITTGRKDSEKGSGALYVAKVRTSGVPESRFYDK